MIELKAGMLKVIVLNAQSIYSIDSSAAKGLEDILTDCQSRGIQFYMTEVIGPVRDTLAKSGLLEKIGEDHIAMRVQDALDHFDSKEKPGRNFPFQSNINSR